MKKVAIIALVILLSGCYVNQMNSWIGQKKQTLIMSWGPPASSADDGNGGEILIYANQVYLPSLGANYWDYKMMYVDNQGLIYHWLKKQENIPPTQIVVSNYYYHRRY